MTSRKKSWRSEDDVPNLVWTHLDAGWDDPTFDFVSNRMDESPDPPVDLWSGLSKLTAKQRFVIELHFGLTDRGICKLEEIATLMGVSHQAVDQIQQRGLEQLRKRLK